MKTNVVVVGAGSYGAQLAKALSSKLDPERHTLTLVSSREFYVHLPATLRMAVSPLDDLENKALIPLDKLFSNVGSFKEGTVTEVKKNQDGKSGVVVLASGEELPWDVLLLAPGSVWEGCSQFPATRSEIKVFLDEWRNKFEKANSIALVGGGAVGIELAGELRDIYPTKKITLIHADEHLVNATYTQGFRQNIAKKLRAINIEILLNTRVEHVDSGGSSGSVKTVDGKTIEADLIVPTRGGHPATAFLSTLSPYPLNTAGQVKVKSTLQLASETNILAVGDVTDIKEQKQAGKVPSYLELVSNNVVELANGGDNITEHKGAYEAIFITIGKNGGAGWAGLLCGLRFGNWVVAHVKGKDLFISWAKKALGQPV